MFLIHVIYCGDETSDVNKNIHLKIKTKYLQVKVELSTTRAQEPTHWHGHPSQHSTEAEVLLSVNPHASCSRLMCSLGLKSVYLNTSQVKLEMWANAQRDGHSAEYRWRPLFNAAKFG